MRNLKLLSSRLWPGDPNLLSPDLGPARALGVMEETHEQCVFLARGCVVVRICPKGGEVMSLDLRTECPLEDDDSILTLQPVFDQLLILTQFRAFTCDMCLENLECLREFPIAILTARWSPNLDLVAFVTQDERLHFASGCDLAARGDEDGLELHPSHFGKAAQVNVGWGKKETQFHGSEGKAAALRKTTSLPSSSPLEVTSRFELSWQGDSDLLAVSAFDPSSGRRALRFWSSDGELHATAEPGGSGGQPLLEGAAVAWRGVGNRVAASARRVAPQAPPEVVLYERNGLQHRQLGCGFAVRGCQGGQWRIGALSWSADLEVLAVGVEEATEGEESGGALCSRVQLWVCGNRHWYLKFELDFPLGSRITALSWDSLESGLLHLLSEDGSYRSFQWGWTTSRSFAPGHHSVVASIDGARLLFTPFSAACVPPPMSASELTLPCPALQVAFSSDADWPDDCAVHLADGSLLLVSLGPSETEEKMEGGVSVQRSIAAGVSPFAVRFLAGPGSLPRASGHLTWHASGLSALLRSDNDRWELFEVRWDSEEIRRRALPTPELPAGLCSSRAGGLFLQSSAGQVWRRCEEGWSEFGRLDCCCADWAVLDPSESCPGGLCLGLHTSLHRLVANEQVLLTNCTSFVVHGDLEFLLTTTTRNCLVSLPLRPKAAAKDLKAAGERCEQSGGGSSGSELVRELERGSRLVTSAAASANVVLQLPRGNLETVSPRALVLAAARAAIDSADYRSSYQLMRRHRVNMNLLFDHAFDRFEAEPGAFLAAIGRADDVNMVLAELNDEDITATLYAAHYGERTAGQPPRTGKVDVICDKLAMECSRDLRRYLSCVLTCLAKRGRLGEALHLVHEQRQAEALDDAGLDVAMRTLGYFAEIGELFKMALGSFDFGMAMLVLDNSSLDPGEHLPFLSALRELPEDLRRFRIDLHIERFERALSHVLPSTNADVFEEALQLIKQKQLFAAALQLYPNEDSHSDEYKTISRAFVEHLRASSSSRSLEDAGRVLFRCGDFPEAARCFLGAPNWRLWAASMASVQREATETSQVAEPTPSKDTVTMAASLEARGEFEAAVRVLAGPGAAPAAALSCAIRGGLWDEAIAVGSRTAALWTQLLAELPPALTSAAQNFRERAEALGAEFGERADRMRAIRKAYRAKVTEEISRWGDEEGVGADLYSETTSLAESSTSSSASSFSSSSSSRRSKKSRRKGERKRWQLKEGSALEGVAIMERLAQMAEAAGRLKMEAQQLEGGLNVMAMSGEAFAVMEAAGRLLRAMRQRRDEVWSDFARAKNPEANRSEDFLPLSRQFEAVLEPFLFHPPAFEEPPGPSPLSCPSPTPC